MSQCRFPARVRKPVAEVEKAGSIVEMDDERDFNRQVFEPLGEGAFRKAYAYRPAGSGHREKVCVLKVAIETEGHNDNKKEVAAWNMPKASNVHDLFLPVVRHDKRGVWNVFPRVKVYGKGLSARQANGIAEELDAKLESRGWYCADLTGNPGNVGITHTGRPVIIDYGFGVRCSRKRKR
jgi:hypothetical protein